MKYLILISTLFLGACSSTPNVNIADTMNLIALTEENAPDGVKGIFKFQVKASGIRRGEVFLNTELDYRDRRAVTIAISPKIVSQLTDKYGSSPGTYFIDKTVEVTGEAKRVKIYLIYKGLKTSKYYFQTHINVSSIEQIKVLG
ncbi:hypothetical protein N9L48_04815 [Psychrosphaera sp.]|nr:hypothetical protein [Psychrosphaera sp.]